MQNRKKVKLIQTMLFLLALGISGLYAQDKDQIGYTSYYFSDNGDNSVITSSFNLIKKILARSVILIDIELDDVTVPPIDGTTGATRPQRNSNEAFKKSRGQVIVGLEQGLDANTSAALNLYRSQEVDYISNSLIGTMSREFFQKNTTITVRGQYNADEVGKITEAGEIINQDKQVYTGAFYISQLLSPTTVLDLGFDGVYMTGFLSDPYRQVKVFDENNAFTLTDEKHPDSRTRYAGTGKISQYLTPVKAAIKGTYRYYTDDWNVSSQTIKFEFNKYVFNDLVFSFSYRYYTQIKGDFYQEKYVGEEFLNDALRTSDYKLRPFNSNTFGLGLTYYFRSLAKAGPDWEFLNKLAIDFLYYRYFNDLDFSANILQGMIKFSI
jgi:hypothetical protein